MRTRDFLRIGVAVLAFTACSEATTPTQTALEDPTVDMQPFAAAEAAALAAEGTGLAGIWVPGATRCETQQAQPKLTEAQATKIRELKAAFRLEMKDEIELIRKVYALAKEAKENGASAARIREILKEAQPALAAFKEAEHKLNMAILAVLTDDQKKNWCYVGT